MSDLIKVVYNDRSATVNQTISAVGATVIKSSRGSAEPVLFYKKQSKRILDYFGIPDTGNEAVDDILSYNDSYPIYVSAPATGGKYGGVLITKTGTEPFIGGKVSKTINFSAVNNYELPTQIADGVITNFTKTISDFANYNHQSITLAVSGVDTTLVASDAEPEVLTCSLGSGTFTRATGVFDFTFTTAPAASEPIEIGYTTDRSSDAYCAIFNKNAQVDDLALKVTAGALSRFTINLYKKSGTVYNLLSDYPKIISMLPGDEDGYKTNLYAEILLKDSDYITPIVNTSLAFSTFVADTANVAFSGGSRGLVDTAALTAGWEYFKSTKYKANIFFDTTADSAIPPIFNTLRNSYQKYAYYILPTTNVSYSDAITAYTSLMTDNKGVAFYWGWGKILNNYTGGIIASSLMGRRALRLADMIDVFNGLAPAWYNENGTHGGQLGSGIIEMFFDADDDAQALLEAARINPTIMHPTFGVVNTRERTSQSLQSDYASIGHVRLADYIVSNIITQALPYQLFKLNDSSHRATVKSQIENIIRPTQAEPYNLLRDFIVKVDEENNNDEVLAREEFVVSVAIKFTPFSKMIFLYFTNTAQGTDVKDNV